MRHNLYKFKYKLIYIPQNKAQKMQINDMPTNMLNEFFKSLF